MKFLKSKMPQVNEQSNLSPDIVAKANLLQQKLQSKLIKLVISDLAQGSANKTLVEKK